MPRRHQGVAASLVNTIVNYSISLGLGFAGTVEVYVNDGGATLGDVLRGYRGGFYMGIGLAVLGILVCTAFLIKTERAKGHKGGVLDQEKGQSRIESGDGQRQQEQPAGAQG